MIGFDELGNGFNHQSHKGHWRIGVQARKLCALRLDQDWAGDKRISEEV